VEKFDWRLARTGNERRETDRHDCSQRERDDDAERIRREFSLHQPSQHGWQHQRNSAAPGSAAGRRLLAKRIARHLRKSTVPAGKRFGGLEGLGHGSDDDSGEDGGLRSARIRNWGFSGNADEVVAKALDSTGGFHLVLAGAKFFLEHRIEPNLVLDRAPDAVISTWSPLRN
jgi:hypothetical protein